MRALCVLATLAALLVAGCTQPQTDCPAGSGAGDCATQTGTQTQPPPSGDDTTLYQFEGIVTGADPPNPNGDGGPLAEQAPVAKSDKFTVPANATDFSITAEVNLGSGAGEIDVYAPDGALVYRSDTQICAGTADAAPSAVCLYMPHDDTPHVTPGEYTVAYHVSGRMVAKVTVIATLPKA